MLDSVRRAFVHGMDAALLASAGIAPLGAVLALKFMPGRKPAAASADVVDREAGLAA